MRLLAALGGRGLHPRRQIAAQGGESQATRSSARRRSASVISSPACALWQPGFPVAQDRGRASRRPGRSGRRLRDSCHCPPLVTGKMGCKLRSAARPHRDCATPFPASRRASADPALSSDNSTASSVWMIAAAVSLPGSIVWFVTAVARPRAAVAARRLAAARRAVRLSEPAVQPTASQDGQHDDEAKDDAHRSRSYLIG